MSEKVMNKCLKLEVYGEPMRVVEEPLPEVPPEGLLVKIQYSGVCHSDRHRWAPGEKLPNAKLPLVLGHEVAGSVYEFGPKADRKDFSVGDRVVVYPWGNCGNCPHCFKDSQVCPITQPGGDGDPYSKARVLGVWMHGGFQSYVAVADTSLIFKVPDSVDLQEACTLPCSAITAHNGVTSVTSAVNEALRINGKATVVLVGAGGLGLWGVQICKALFPKTVRVCVVDTNEEKLVDAKKAGADLTVRWSADKDDVQGAVRQLIEACGGRFEAAVDFVGLSLSVQRLAVAAQTGSTITVVGLAGGDLPPLPLAILIRRALRIQGVYVGNKAALATVLQLYIDGKIKAPPTSTVSLEEVNDVFAAMKDGTLKGRAVIKF